MRPITFASANDSEIGYFSVSSIRGKGGENVESKLNIDEDRD